MNVLGQKDNNKLFEKDEAIYKMEYPLSENNVKKSLNNIKKPILEKTKKSHVLGEIWGLFNEEYSQHEYNGELKDFEIDNSVENIFIAA